MSKQFELFPGSRPERPAKSKERITPTLAKLFLVKGWEQYGLFLTGAQWKYKCKLAHQRDNWTCQLCFQHISFKQNMALHVHHLTYARFGNERLSDLQTVCAGCHNQADEVRRYEVWARGLFTYTTRRIGIDWEKEAVLFDEWLGKKGA